MGFLPKKLPDVDRFRFYTEIPVQKFNGLGQGMHRIDANPPDHCGLLSVFLRKKNPLYPLSFGHKSD